MYEGSGIVGSLGALGALGGGNQTNNLGLDDVPLTGADL